MSFYLLPPIYQPGSDFSMEMRGAPFYTLKRFDLFSPMCIILIDGTAKSKEADHGRDACAGQAIRQSCGRADGTGR
jgi:hypothetical protein